jgi:hypothetical protein
VSPICSPLDKVFAHKVFATTYVFLLGFVLPFICWGTLATPGHPHQMSHFVFLMPLLRENALQTMPLVHQSHDYEGAHPVDSPTPPPVGRSVPAQLSTAISLFDLFLVGQTLLLFYLIYTSSRVYLAPNRHLFNLRVITPPPRRLYL